MDSSSPAPMNRPGLPRWGWVLVIGLVAALVVAVATAITASRNTAETTIILPPAASTPGASPSSSASGTPSAASKMADGCLGGREQLDRSVLLAQAEAPLDELGAAAFTATLVRWAMNGPPPPFQKITAKKILTEDATSAARNFLSSSKDLEGSGGVISFARGKYYIEIIDSGSATVSFLATSNLTLNGIPQGEVYLAGAIQLESINGTWHFQNFSTPRSTSDMRNIGIDYAGGC